MRYLYSLFLLLSMPVVSYGQYTTPEVIASGGDSYVQSFARMDLTIGEPITETVSNGNNTLTQGFQQGDYNIASIGEQDIPSAAINVFPNPAVDYITIRLTEGPGFRFALYEITGALLVEQSGNIGEVRLDISSYAVGCYLLKVTLNSGETGKMFKITKFK